MMVSHRVEGRPRCAHERLCCLPWVKKLQAPAVAAATAPVGVADLQFRLIGIGFEAVFALIRALLMPARLLWHRAGG